MAWAHTGGIAIHLLCPALTGDARAEFEARAQVDLSARATRGGELQIQCDGLRADVRWRPHTLGWFERSVPVTASPAALVDALLAAVADAAREGVKAEESPLAGETSELGTESPSKRLRLLDPGPAVREGEPSPDRERAGSSPSVPLAFGLSAGGHVAIFSTRGSGAAGPRLGVFMAILPSFEASVVGEYGIGFGAGDFLTVRMPSATALLSARFGPGRAFEVGVGGSLGALVVSASAPYRPGEGLSREFLAGVARGRYVLQVASWRLSVGPELRVYSGTTEVRVDGVSLWELPLVAAGIALDVSAQLAGPR